jgi:hypothetical protein
MNSISTVVLTLCALVLLAACKPELLSTIKDAESVTVYLYKTDKAVDRVVDKRVVKQGSAGYKALVEWAKKNKSDWMPATTTYPPVLVLECKEFSLNVRKDLLIFKYKEGEYSKKTTVEDYLWFKKQLGLIESP